MDIKAQLLAMKDDGYKNFHGKLIPTVNPEAIIGIRVPVLRKFVKRLAKSSSAEVLDVFMHELPHQYYEENNVHAFLIEQIDDFDKCIAELDNFLPYVDNWATCDMMNPKVLKENTDKLLCKIKMWLDSSHVYTIRFGIGMLMRCFLDDNFSSDYLDMVVAVHSDEYYVNMMKAWFFATALTKQYEAALPYIRQNRLDVWSHNKTIQKSTESFCIPKERKEELKKLRRR